MRRWFLLLLLSAACTTAAPTTTTDTCEEVRRLFDEPLQTLNELVELDTSISDTIYREPVYKLSILVEQNPSCFSVNERLDAELWRQIYDAVEPRGKNPPHTRRREGGQLPEVSDSLDYL